MKTIPFFSNSQKKGTLAEFVLLLVFSAPALAAGPADGVITKVGEAYVPKPEIKFVIDGVKAKPVVKPAEALAVTPVVAAVVTPVVVAPPPEPLFELEKGKSVEAQLRAYGKRAGWDLFWQAPEYVLDQNTTLASDFESSVIFFLKGTNEAGAHLQAVFYRGNKTVRITEF